MIKSSINLFEIKGQEDKSEVSQAYLERKKKLLNNEIAIGEIGTPKATESTPTFKTAEEALEYAKQNNIKVANTNVKPTLAGGLPAITYDKQLSSDSIYKDYGLTNGDVNILNDLNLKYYGNSGSIDADKNFIRDYIWVTKQLYSQKTGKEYTEVPSVRQYALDVAKYEYEKDQTLKGKAENVVQGIGQTIKTMATGSTSAVTDIYDSVTNKLKFKIPVETKDITSYNSKYSNMNLKEIYEATGDKELASKINRANHSIGQLELWAKTYANGDESKKEINNLINQLKSGTYKGRDEDVKNKVEEIKTIIVNEDKTTWANDLYAKTLEQNEYRYSEPAKKVVNALGTVSEQLPTLTMGAVGGAPASTLGIYSRAEGSATKQALKEGATYNKANAYGMGVGLLETGTEMLLGSAWNKALGLPGLAHISRPIQNKIRNITNLYIKGAINYIGDILGEDFEEGISAVIEPYIKRATYDKTAGFKNLREALNAFTTSFIDSTLSSAIMGAGASAINTSQMIQVQKEVNNHFAVFENAIESSNLTKSQKKEALNEVKEAKKDILRKVFNPSENQQNSNNLQNEILQDKVTTPNIQKSEISQNNTNTITQLQPNNINNLANDINTSYNQTKGGVLDGEQEHNTGRINRSDIKQARLYKNEEQKQTKEYRRKLYEEYEKSIEPINEEELEVELIKARDEINKKYNKDIIIYNKSDGEFNSGASYLNDKKIYINYELIQDFGIKRLGVHEVMESDILHNQKAREVLYPIINDIIEDAFFDEQKAEFLIGQEGEIPSDELIAKDVLCDRFAEIENGEKTDYDFLLTEKTLNKIDNAIKEYKEITYKNSEQQSFYFLNENKTGYENVPDSLMGFAKDSANNKRYDETKYPYNLDLEISVDGGKTFFEDSIKGMNYNHALERAKRNWQGAILKQKNENPLAITAQKAKLALENSHDVNIVQNQNYVNTKTNNLKNSKQSSFPLDKNIPKTDNQGRELTPEQQDFFKDSKVRDTEGRLEVMYHATNTDFSIFDINKSKDGLYGKGFYFTNDKNFSKNYGNILKEVYLNFKNPLYANDSANQKSFNNENITEFLEQVYENENIDLNKYGKWATVENFVKRLENNNDWDIITQIKQTFGIKPIKLIEMSNKLGITNYDSIIARNEMIAFKSNQIKSTDNTNPTDNPDILKSQKTNSNYNYSYVEELLLDKNFINSRIQNRLKDVFKPLKMNTKQYKQINSIIESKANRIEILTKLNAMTEEKIEDIINEISKGYILDKEKNDTTLENFIKKKYGDKKWNAILNDLQDALNIIKNRFTKEIGKIDKDLINKAKQDAIEILKGAKKYTQNDIDKFLNGYANDYEKNMYSNLLDTFIYYSRSLEEIEASNYAGIKKTNYLIEKRKWDLQHSEKIEQGTYHNGVSFADIRKTIEKHIGKDVRLKGFRQRAYGIYKAGIDEIRVKDISDIDTTIHELGHRFDYKEIKRNSSKEMNAELEALCIRAFKDIYKDDYDTTLKEGWAEFVRRFICNN